MKKLWIPGVSVAILGGLVLFAVGRGQEQGRPVADASGPVVQAAGNQGTAHGITVKILAITDQPQYGGNTAFRASDHSWSVDGSPSTFPYTQRSYGTFEFALPGNSGRSVNTRFLTIELTTPSRETFDMYCYVPGEGEGEFDVDVPNRSVTDKSVERMTIAVPDPKASLYRYGIAAGPWKEVADLKITVPKEKSADLGSGFWGKMRMVGLEEADRRQTGPNGISKRIIPFVSFEIDAPRPRVYSYRIRHFDKSGSQIGEGATIRPVFDRDAQTKPFVVDHIKVDVRPYTWIEFSNVHYDADFSKWSASYWGEEGDKAVVRDSETGMELRGVVRTHLQEGFWQPNGDFAPDGKQWRDFPDWQLSEASQIPDGPSYKNTMIAVMSLFNKLEPSNLARLDVLESTSSEPGQGLGKVIAARFTHVTKTPRPVQTVMFQRPTNASYVQVRARYPSTEWRAIGELKPPTAKLRQPDAKTLEAFKKGSVGYATFRIMVRGSGRIDESYLPEQNGWIDMSPIEHDAETGPVRVLARLKNGTKVVLQHNAASSAGDTYFEFNMTPDGDAIIEEPDVLLSAVEAFVVEAKRYTIDRYFPLRLPSP